jgi:hypothetical protein
MLISQIIPFLSENKNDIKIHLETYMFNDIITQCENNVLSMPCCHNDGRDCYCYNCLYAGFRNTPDEYDCDKKMNYYVLKYGSSYVSEIYHYLENSLLIESLNITNINILSLGCGFCPDYYAVSQYIANKKLKIDFQYYGLDISMAWNTTRLSYSNVHYEQSDLLQPFNIQNAHIIMLNKIFQQFIDMVCTIVFCQILLKQSIPQ